MDNTQNNLENISVDGEKTSLKELFEESEKIARRVNIRLGCIYGGINRSYSDEKQNIFYRLFNYIKNKVA